MEVNTLEQVMAAQNVNAETFKLALTNFKNDKRQFAIDSHDGKTNVRQLNALRDIKLCMVCA